MMLLPSNFRKSLAIGVELRELIQVPDGRALECWASGPPEGLALLFITGTPSSGRHFEVVAESAARLGWRTLSFARPGYGRSTPQPGRSVADFASDAAEVLSWAGAAEFVAVGWSGGGPHALACAALVPGCRAAAVIAGVAPRSAVDLDWLGGMGEENVAEFGAAIDGVEALEAFLSRQLPGMTELAAADLAEALGDLAPDVDRAVLGGDFGAELAESFRGAVATGIAGWRDDDLAFVRAWGFDPAAIEIPVMIWQGALDRMVPAAHGAWLGRAVPGAEILELPGDGHITPIANRMPEITARLAGLVE